VEPWQRVLEAILNDPGIAVMLGDADVGKTTTATTIANAAVRAGYRTVVVDTDIGQSDIGPPATVGLAPACRPVLQMDQLPAAAAFFVGDTQPQFVYRYLVEGAVRSVEWARHRGAQVIVVDTTGSVEGPAAVAAKARKIRAIGPRHVVALQRRGELEPILARLPEGTIVHRLPPSSRARTRSREMRRIARAHRFRQYFASARRHVVELAAFPANRPAVYAGRHIPQVRMLAEIPAPALRHLLVGLADRGGWLAAVGSIIETTPAAQTVAIAAPLRSLAGVSGLQWGVLRVAPSGTEEGRLQWRRRHARPRREYCCDEPAPEGT
jgi:polynucleotide 5'-hydroxyl-kinase GRC3/NOL9